MAKRAGVAVGEAGECRAVGSQEASVIVCCGDVRLVGGARVDSRGVETKVIDDSVREADEASGLSCLEADCRRDLVENPRLDQQAALRVPCRESGRLGDLDASALRAHGWLLRRVAGMDRRRRMKRELSSLTSKMSVAVPLHVNLPSSEGQQPARVRTGPAADVAQLFLVVSTLFFVIPKTPSKPLFFCRYERFLYTEYRNFWKVITGKCMGCGDFDVARALKRGWLVFAASRSLLFISLGVLKCVLRQKVKNEIWD